MVTSPLVARLRSMLEKATPGEWALYDSNSWRRIGLKAQYREILWPCRANDGIADFSGPNRENDLAALIACKNAVPALLSRIEALEAAMGELNAANEKFLKEFPASARLTYTSRLVAAWAEARRLMDSEGK